MELDRTHPQLRTLDSLKASGLAYECWHADVREAEALHMRGSFQFDDFLDQMRRKQKMHTGDRSNEQLRALDALISSGLTYDGWQADVHEAIY